MLGNLIGGFIVILVGVSLMPPIADSVFAARFGPGNNATNVTGPSGTIVGLLPLFFSLGVLSAGIAVTVAGMKNAGIM